MVEQFMTKTRPNLDVPFFEDSDEGRARSDAIIQLASDHPEPVLSRESMQRPATDLVWTATWTFVGIEEYRTFLQLAYDYDTALRLDRAKYYMNNGHSLLVEHKIEGVPDRTVLINITPANITTMDGSVYTEI
jgi:hypothetical protein